jgi:prepilin-type N-terminal cleavage/methylation domain-containing protein
MSNTFKKTSVRGFTLIELLVVIAIIGLLSTIIAAPIQSARKKARDAKKIAELKSTELALEQYAESNSAQYPTNPFGVTGGLSPQFMPLLPTFAASTTSNARDAFAYAYYVASSTGAGDQIFAYHFGVKLEVYGPALETDRDCVGPLLGPSLLTPYCAVYNGNFLSSFLVDNGSNLAQVANASSSLGQLTIESILVDINGSDFQSTLNYPGVAAPLSPYSEVSTSTCVAVKDCIFDVTSQQ